MRQVGLVTDSSCGLSAESAARLGVTIVPGSFAFDSERISDEPSAWQAAYARMAGEGVPPRTFGVAEAAWQAAFTRVLDGGCSVLCLVTPFDVAPSFTTASAAMLSVQDQRPEAPIKIANPGTSGAGMAALLMSLSRTVAAGASLANLLELLEDLEPQTDSLGVMESTAWLEGTGRLAMLEERLGVLDGRLPVVRVGTRLTGVAAVEDPGDAVARAVEIALARSGTGAVNACVLHASNPAGAGHAAELLNSERVVSPVEVGVLPVGLGAQLGPGAVCVGVCPVERGTDA
jgi:fatty acid-binding protein DegV